MYFKILLIKSCYCIISGKDIVLKKQHLLLVKHLIEHRKTQKNNNVKVKITNSGVDKFTNFGETSSQ